VTAQRLHEGQPLPDRHPEVRGAGNGIHRMEIIGPYADGHQAAHQVLQDGWRIVHTPQKNGLIFAKRVTVCSSAVYERRPSLQFECFCNTD
jgi:hypothetical protein